MKILGYQALTRGLVGLRDGDESPTLLVHDVRQLRYRNRCQENEDQNVSFVASRKKQTRDSDNDLKSNRFLNILS